MQKLWQGTTNKKELINEGEGGQKNVFEKARLNPLPVRARISNYENIIKKSASVVSKAETLGSKKESVNGIGHNMFSSDSSKNYVLNTNGNNIQIKNNFGNDNRNAFDDDCFGNYLVENTLTCSNELELFTDFNQKNNDCLQTKLENNFQNVCSNTKTKEKAENTDENKTANNEEIMKDKTENNEESMDTKMEKNEQSNQSNTEKNGQSIDTKMEKDEESKDDNQEGEKPSRIKSRATVGTREGIAGRLRSRKLALSQPETKDKDVKTSKGSESELTQKKTNQKLLSDIKPAQIERMTRLNTKKNSEYETCTIEYVKIKKNTNRPLAYLDELKDDDDETSDNDEYSESKSIETGQKAVQVLESQGIATRSSCKDLILRPVAAKSSEDEVSEDEVSEDEVCDEEDVSENSGERFLESYVIDDGGEEREGRGVKFDKCYVFNPNYKKQEMGNVCKELKPILCDKEIAVLSGEKNTQSGEKSGKENTAVVVKKYKYLDDDSDSD
ncbi:hypothetical protein BB559_002291 [Furculomyces boomerangus]|uniref:Uncharacterized protein n=1 Tax=Furculomyces boomerangus TaxID=61424 RepID=A0A2T9YWG6_9FUNG|nr:hypothetical protein BB559_002291 [Furculomyces boomerangus]